MNPSMHVCIDKLLRADVIEVITNKIKLIQNITNVVIGVRLSVK